eukprot:15039938-Alexandrium_andersonii.AAC.1
MSSSSPRACRARAIGGPMAATPHSRTGGRHASAPPAQNSPNGLASRPTGLSRPRAQARRPAFRNDT